MISKVEGNNWHCNCKKKKKSINIKELDRKICAFSYFNTSVPWLIKVVVKHGT